MSLLELIGLQTAISLERVAVTEVSSVDRTHRSCLHGQITSKTKRFVAKLTLHRYANLTLYVAEIKELHFRTLSSSLKATRNYDQGRVRLSTLLHV